MDPFKILYRTWFTGVLYCLSVLGYLFYGMVVLFRMIQTKKIITVISLFLLGFLLAGGAAVVYLLVPFQQPGGEVVVIVEPGTTVRSVANQLRKNEVIPNTRAFLAWVKYTKLEKSMQSGKYTFYRYEGILKAAPKLSQAVPIEESVTFPEGLTIEQTAQKASEVFPVDTAEFARLCSDGNFIQKLGLSESSLEGYLFPDTYRFPPDTKEEQIITRMVQLFLREFNSIPQTELSKTFTRHEIITLASIVEEEATLAEERTRIAGVFHNRLRRKVPLGADPTVRYALKKFSGPLRVSELKNPSPYNTRIHRGLPPGPICSPGKGAIAASIEPMDTKELYFVAKWDGSGAHDFSVTNAQHDRKKHEIRRQNYLRKKKLKGKK